MVLAPFDAFDIELLAWPGSTSSCRRISAGSTICPFVETEVFMRVRLLSYLTECQRADRCRPAYGPSQGGDATAQVDQRRVTGARCHSCLKIRISIRILRHFSIKPAVAEVDPGRRDLPLRHVLEPGSKRTTRVALTVPATCVAFVHMQPIGIRDLHLKTASGCGACRRRERIGARRTPWRTHGYDEAGHGCRERGHENDGRPALPAIRYGLRIGVASAGSARRQQKGTGS